MVNILDIHLLLVPSLYKGKYKKLIYDLSDKYKGKCAEWWYFIKLQSTVGEQKVTKKTALVRVKLLKDLHKLILFMTWQL